MGSVRPESAVAYFKEQVEGALARQRVEAGELTSFYVVNLLAGFLRRPAGDDEPLALQLARAIDRGGAHQRAGLKQIGDLDYYAAIGGFAYASLSRTETDSFSSVFAELAEKFITFTDVLSEVSERTWCTSNGDLLRLYEKWLQTGSRRSGQLLLEHGVVPVSAGRSNTVQ
jgi:hypothetical protein